MFLIFPQEVFTSERLRLQIRKIKERRDSDAGFIEQVSDKILMETTGESSIFGDIVDTFQRGCLRAGPLARRTYLHFLSVKRSIWHGLILPAKTIKTYA